jgi:hypothetical protein
MTTETAERGFVIAGGVLGACLSFAATFGAILGYTRISLAVLALGLFASWLRTNLLLKLGGIER